MAHARPGVAGAIEARDLQCRVSMGMIIGTLNHNLDHGVAKIVTKGHEHP